MKPERILEKLAHRRKRDRFHLVSGAISDWRGAEAQPIKLA
jgi:hypothetical protein